MLLCNRLWHNETSVDINHGIQKHKRKGQEGGASVSKLCGVTQTAQ